jgi:hypothetical protein
MTRDKPRDRRVIRHPITRQDPKRHILAAMTLDRPRRPHISRKRIQNQGHHHRRLVGRPAVPIRAIRRVERREIHPLDRVDHKPREMILRQPVPQ